MMYGYMTLADDTGNAHSEMKADGSLKSQKHLKNTFLIIMQTDRWQ